MISVDWIMDGDSTIEKPKQSSNYLQHPLLKDKAIEGRPYQALLLSSIIKYNSLVVSPTGTGKSVLFLLAIIHALRNTTGYAILLAPTLALNDQLIQFFKEKTTFPSQSILSITGKVPPKHRQQLWNTNARIIVCTPETLVNDLQTNLVDLSQCRLIVVDEAHHSTQEKYIRIMNYIIDARASGNPLRILALSATIPEVKLLEIMSVLDLEHIEIQTPNDPELIPYMIKAQNEKIFVPLPELWHQVMDELRALRSAALRGISRHQSLIKTELNETASRSTLLAALEHLQSQELAHIDQKVRSGLSTRLAAAIKLDHALDVFARQGKTAFLEFSQKLYNEPSKANKQILMSPQFQHAIEIVSGLDQEHPKIRELLRILETDSAKSVMIFSKSKSTVFQLVKILQEQGIKTAALVGKQNLGEKQRNEILESFRQDQIRVLACTSVGEEGLDVGCDLVIFYDSTASVIRHVQRQGRLRTHGKVIFLIAKDTLDEVFFWTAMGEEKKMRNAFDRLKNISGRSYLNDQTPQQNPSVKSPDINTGAIIPKANNKAPKPSKDIGNSFVIKVDPRVSELISSHPNTDSIKIIPLNGPSLVIGHLAVFRYQFLDLIHELSSGVLLPKLMKAAKAFEKCMILLEGDRTMELLKTVKIHKKTVLKTILAIVLDLNISMIPTASVTETKHILKLLIEHQSSVKPPTDMMTKQEHLIMALPGISKLLAKRLLSTYQSPIKILNLSENQFLELSGIGAMKSQQIIALLHSLYNDPQ